jgi:hypothetical protein
LRWRSPITFGSTIWRPSSSKRSSICSTSVDRSRDHLEADQVRGGALVAGLDLEHRTQRGDRDGELMVRLTRRQALQRESRAITRAPRHGRGGARRA